MTKERYLAHHIRVNIPMCCDAMTTSPVESMNNLTKNTMRIGANMNLSTTVVTLVEEHSARYEKHVNKMLLKMDSTNLGSKAHTKRHIHHQCQAMIDLFHENSQKLKCVQQNDHEWLCWNFIDPESSISHPKSWEGQQCVGIDEEIEDVHEKSLVNSMKVPHFLNVYRLVLNYFDGTLFLQCSCRHFERYEYSCADAVTPYINNANYLTDSSSSHTLQIWLSLCTCLPCYQPCTEA